MVNPFTAQSKISRIQQDVLQPLYTMHDGQLRSRYDWLLVETGRAIAKHQKYIEEVSSSKLVAAVFKIVKMLGGADQLTEEDFGRFTSYVNDGGIKAMIKMLLAADKEKTFAAELQNLPQNVKENAPLMLAKSKTLHHDFITGFLKENYGSVQKSPEKLRENFAKSAEFIERLTQLAAAKLKR